MRITNTPANMHTSAIRHRRLRGVLVCTLAAAWALMAGVAAAQVVHPTQAERAQHTAHAQYLKSQQQSRKLRQRRNRRINRTASKAYADQPKVLKQMHHAGNVRQRQFKARDKAHKKKLERAERPLPTRVTPAHSGSGG